MKKISISIPTPCHENWEAMLPQDKGRFCGSCQKTVVDFSTMSDRQIAEFFKKPAGSVCGRFHTDQLEREIQIPRKRIPWANYFFHLSWPAFVIFLKSCAHNETTIGVVLAEPQSDQKNSEIPVGVLGNFIPQITAVDSLPVEKPVPQIENIEHTLGKVAPQETVTGDTIAFPINHAEENIAIKESDKPLDTVNIIGYNSHRMGRLVAGGISVIKCDNPQPEIIVEKEPAKENLAFIAYPNPVKAGAQLTIQSSTTEDVPKQIQLISSNGSLVYQVQNNSLKGASITVPLPSGMASGTYFVQIITEKLASKTIKIVVLN